MRRTKTTSLVAALGLTLTLGTGAAIVPSMGAAQAAPAAEVSISGLEVNHLVEPEGVFGIDDPKPVFCWGFDSNVVGSKQASYRIEVATTPAFNANKVVWDSGVVNSDETTDITYGSTGTAKALRPETDYYWRVSAVDNRGVPTTSKTGKFATGLMNGKIGAWDGAQWVGNDDVRLDAKSTMMFDVNAKFTINTGDNASFIFGANDPRLTSDFRNVYGGPGGENFIRFELDLSGVTGDPATNTGGVINIYRKGYHATDDDNGDPNVMPYKSVRLVDSTAAAVKNLFSPANKNAEHALRIQGNASVMTYSIDGVALTGFTGNTMTIGAGRPAQNNNLNVTPNSTIDSAGVHTFRTGNNFNTFPHLGGDRLLGEERRRRRHRHRLQARRRRAELRSAPCSTPPRGRTTASSPRCRTPASRPPATPSGSSRPRLHSSARSTPTPATPARPRCARSSASARARTSTRPACTSPLRAPTRCSSTGTGSARTTSTPACPPSRRR